jgi:nucleotide-binding universal stress UspA family protein
MFERILVPLDGSPRAEQALRVAARIARASGGSVMLLQVVSPPIDYAGGLTHTPLMMEQVIETELAISSGYLDRVARSKDHGRELAEIETTTKVMFGLPAQDILAMAELRSVDLIVMCSHGRTGFTRWVLGSVAQKITHHCPVPVLVLREGKLLLPESPPDTARHLTALVPLDGSPLAEAALVPAANLVAALAAPAPGALHLTQVVKQLSTTADEGFVTQLNEEAVERAKAYLMSVKEHLQQALKDRRLTISWSVALDSDAADAIIGTAEQREQQEGAEGSGGCDLIAMSTHGRGGLERWLIGSVTERVLNTTKLPLLVVRPEQGKAKDEAR